MTYKKYYKEVLAKIPNAIPLHCFNPYNPINVFTHKDKYYLIYSIDLDYKKEEFKYSKITFIPEWFNNVKHEQLSDTYSAYILNEKEFKTYEKVAKKRTYYYPLSKNYIKKLDDEKLWILDITLELDNQSYNPKEKDIDEVYSLKDNTNAIKFIYGKNDLVIYKNNCSMYATFPLLALLNDLDNVSKELKVDEYIFRLFMTNQLSLVNKTYQYNKFYAYIIKDYKLKVDMINNLTFKGYENE